MNPLPPKQGVGRAVEEDEIKAGESVLSRTSTVKQLMKKVRRPVLASMVTRSRSVLGTNTINISSMTARQLADELWSLVCPYDRYLHFADIYFREESMSQSQKLRRRRLYLARHDWLLYGTTCNIRLCRPGSVECPGTSEAQVMEHSLQTSGAPYARSTSYLPSYDYGVRIPPKIASTKCSPILWIS